MGLSNSYTLILTLFTFVSSIAAWLLLRRTKAERMKYEREEWLKENIDKPAIEICRKYRVVISSGSCGWASNASYSCGDAETEAVAVKIARHLLIKGDTVSNLYQILDKAPRVTGEEYEVTGQACQGGEYVYSADYATVEFPDPKALNQALSDMDVGEKDEEQAFPLKTISPFRGCVGVLMLIVAFISTIFCVVNALTRYNWSGHW